jgi:hypothetical protein
MHYVISSKVLERIKREHIFWRVLLEGLDFFSFVNCSNDGKGGGSHYILGRGLLTMQRTVLFSNQELFHLGDMKGADLGVLI